jgi:hypothetical protein
MRKVSKADQKENTSMYSGCTFLEPREWMDNAIVGKCVATNGIIYDKEIVIECFMAMDNLSYEQAEQVVDFNTFRVIPYLPDPKPIVRTELETEWDEEPAPDDEDIEWD